MSALAILAFATPIFGFALTPPSASPPSAEFLRVPVLAQVGGEEAPDQAEGAAAPEEAESSEEVPEAELAAEPEPAPEPELGTEPEAGGSDMSDYAAQLRQRQEIATVHRALGIATWGAMLVTVGLGMIQYYNLYGFGSGLDSTPCVTGNAVFGQDQCWGAPWVHRTAVIGTTLLYTTTFALSLAMPDPDNVSEGRGAFAEKMRIHETLRWVHFAGMLAQVFLGLASGQNWFGLDRANDFEAQRAIASVHQGIGLATFGVLTAAGAIMLF